MNNVVKMEDYKYPWREAFAVDGVSSSLQFYVNDRTGEVEVIQQNDEGDTIRTVLNATDAQGVRIALQFNKTSAR